MRDVLCIPLLMLLVSCGVADDFTELSALHPHGVYLYLPAVESGASKLLRLDEAEPEHTVNFRGDINRPMVAPQGRWLASLTTAGEVRIGVVGAGSETGVVRRVCPEPQFLDSAWLTAGGLYTSCHELFDPPGQLLLDDVLAPQQCPFAETVVAIGPAGHVLCESAVVAPSGTVTTLSSSVVLPSAAWRIDQGWMVVGQADDLEAGAFTRWTVTDDGTVQAQAPVPALPGGGSERRFLLGDWRGFVGRASDGRLFFMVTAPGENDAKEIWSYTPGDEAPVRLDSVQHHFKNTDHIRILSGL